MTAFIKQGLSNAREAAKVGINENTMVSMPLIDEKLQEECMNEWRKVWVLHKLLIAVVF